MNLSILEILQHLTHYGLHFLFPGVISYFLFRDKWKKARLIMIATMVIDLDHLIADPIFDPDRCGIGIHPLHSFYALIIYFIMLGFPKFRIMAVGLLFHIYTDFQDCIWMKYVN